MSTEQSKTNAPIVSIGDTVKLDLVEHEGAGGVVNVIAFVTAVNDDGSIDVAWRDSFMIDREYRRHERTGVARVIQRKLACVRDIHPSGIEYRDHTQWTVVPRHLSMP